MYNLEHVADRGSKSQIKPFHSLRPADWPDKSHLNLDESQMEAFQLALTQELAIIQGPPGTGKTYVGLKIAQALLTNQKLWSAGIFKFQPRSIVRVGGRSNSEILKPFMLKNQMDNFRKGNSGRRMPFHLRDAFGEGVKEGSDEDMDTMEDNAVAEGNAFIQIVAEADQIHAERFVEDGFDLPLREIDREQGVREAEQLMLAMTFANEVKGQEGQREEKWQSAGLRLWKGLICDLDPRSATCSRLYMSFSLRYRGGSTSGLHSTMYLKWFANKKG
ncbi:hypothetical protein CRUP_006724 [Coryphaenoides rupestris]|nr:hypothetical protein CRUP_006724 [Coryphaenoides rupestris]